MKRKSILSILLIIVFYCLIISLCSCDKDENPVIPPEPPPPPPVQPDTVSRYKWNVVLNYMEFLTLYAADTNRIYINGDYRLIIFNGVNFDPVIIQNDYRVYSVYGYDKNNIFAPGYLRKGDVWIPAVKKITNGNIQTYAYENELDMGVDILVTGPDQAWFSSYYESKVYYYDNGNITTYRLSDNDSINCGNFYMDQNNRLFVFAQKLKGYSGFFGTLYTYKFNGNSFDSLRTDIIALDNPDGKTSMILRCGKDVLMLPQNVNLQKIYYFNGYEWIVHSSPKVEEQGVPTKIGGISKDSLVAFYSPNKTLYTYGSSKKWRKENNSPYINPSLDVCSNIEIRFGNVYITSCAMDIGWGWIIVGKPNINSANSNYSFSNSISK